MPAPKAIMIRAPAALREPPEAITSRVVPVRPLAASPPGPLTTTTVAAKASLHAIAQRWLDLDAEIRSHEAHLGRLTGRCAPEMAAVHGKGPRPRRRC